MNDDFLNTNIANIFCYLSLAISLYTNLLIIYLTCHSKANICPSLCAVVQTSDPKVAGLTQKSPLSKCSIQSGFCERLFSNLFDTNQCGTQITPEVHNCILYIFLFHFPFQCLPGPWEVDLCILPFQRTRGCPTGMSNSAFNFLEHTHKTDVEFH